MGSPGGNRTDWFDEFKKLNTSPGASPPPAPAATEAPPPGRDSQRRRHERFALEDAQVSLYKGGLFTRLGFKDNQARTAIDLSEGGARILIRERIPAGTKVRVTIQMEKYSDIIEAEGEIRWCHQSAKKAEDIYVGVQFLNLDPVQMRKISQMREWFTSPQYRAKKKQRPPSEILQIK